MSYEHKLIIARRSEHTSITGKIVIFGEEIARYNCSRMPASFHSLFRDHGMPVDFDLYIHDGDEPSRLDNYGEHCRMIDPAAVLDYLEALQGSGDDWSTYRRIYPLIGLLRGFSREQWEATTPEHTNRLVIVNYGY